MNLITSSYKTRKKIGIALLMIFLIALAFIWLVPFFFVFMTAVKSQKELLTGNIFGFPTLDWQWGNFEKAWTTGRFSIYFRNNVFLILAKVPLGIMIASLAAYPLAKMKFKFDNFLFGFMLLGLAIPVQVVLTPLLVMLKHMGIQNTILALLPPYVVFGLPFQILVMRGFFRSIPTELVEAARVDGASELRIFFTIMLPLAVPALATLFIVDALATWNELLIPLVLISSDELRPVPVGLLQFQGQYATNFPVLMAGVMISIIPIIILYLFLQRYLVAGLTQGAVKG
jgi:raffinose/stachyose/melibiose transport system permease protein